MKAAVESQRLRILTGRNKGYTGSVSIGTVELSEILEESIVQNITYISHYSHLFKGTVRDNLLMGKPDATEEEMWGVLERVNLANFLREECGLILSFWKRPQIFQGQCQRLILARALLHDSEIYILMRLLQILMWKVKTIFWKRFTILQRRKLLSLSHIVWRM